MAPKNQDVHEQKFFLSISNFQKKFYQIFYTPTFSFVLLCYTIFNKKET